VDLWLALPFELRLAILFLVGLVVGGQVNRGIYRLAWSPRQLGPWSAPPEKALPRHWSDRLPVVGWWGLRRETNLHGPGFWIRPMLIELALGLGFAWLYHWEINGGLLPAPLTPPMADAHVQYFSHIFLLSLMTVATFIDFDEKTIPDAITVPGLLLGLLLAAVWPNSHLPIFNTDTGAIENLQIVSPRSWPAYLSEEPRWLAVAVALYLAWCLAVTPAVLTMRHGLVRAVRYWLASMFKHGTIWRFVLLAALGTGWIFTIWFVGGGHWQGLFSAIVGMAFGGGLVWSVRIIAGAALRKEAMGFGDVTLMAMIGAFVGWQPSMYIFFLAPFLGILIALAQFLVTRRPDIAYGPYLCAATVVAVLLWGRIWTNWLEDIFALGWLIPTALAVCLVLMGVMLGALQLVKRLLFGDEA
jgi:prepilin signal peptidase PulO-like enzyme (type II secretory pathway)